jgi:hypothetical protein
MALTLSNRVLVRPLNGAIVHQYVAASAVQLGEWVYCNASDQVAPARSNAAGTTYAIGIVVSIEGGLSTAAAGQAVGVCIQGPVAGFTGMTPATPYVYVSQTTAGVGTQTIPTGGANFVYTGGRAIRSDILFVQPQNTLAAAGA